MSKIKICGLSRPMDIEAANILSPDYIGFVFAKSRRQVDAEQALVLRQGLSQEIQAVGVFVNEPSERILGLVEKQIIDLIQLHGSESEDTIRFLKERTSVPIVKAISVTSKEDILVWEQSLADYLLLDNGTGGTGQRFDWSLIPKLNKDYFLAGGITPENLDRALEIQPYGIDTSGGVETDGWKDPEKMRIVIEQVRDYDIKRGAYHV